MDVKESEPGMFYHRCPKKSVFDGGFSFRHHSFRGDDHTEPSKKANTTGSVSRTNAETAL